MEMKAKSRATIKYEKKMGLVSKTYKLRLTDVEEFRAACAESGESQASVLTRLMRSYIQSRNVEKKKQIEDVPIKKTTGKFIMNMKEIIEKQTQMGKQNDKYE